MKRIQISTVEKTVQAVERCMKQKIDLDVISSEVGLSKFHLHHVFKSLTNKPLITYVRNRKLSCSLHELLDTDLNIIDIATEYHFEHEQSYIRAFKQRFNMTPAEFRRIRCQLEIEPMIDTNRLQQVGEGIIIQPQIVMLPVLHLEGIQDEIVHSENYTYKTTNQLAERFWSEYRPQIPNVKDDETYYGLVIYSEHPEISNGYATCVEVYEPNPECEPFVQFTLPAQEYAVFRYIGLHNPHKITFQTVLELYKYIEKEWLVHTSYHLKHPYHFEKVDLSIGREDYCEMDLYFPIELKAEEK